MEDSDFDTMSNLVTYIPAKELPFPLVGAGVADWFSTYGFTDDSEYSWSGKFCFAKPFDTPCGRKSELSIKYVLRRMLALIKEPLNSLLS